METGTKSHCKGHGYRQQWETGTILIICLHMSSFKGGCEGLLRCSPVRLTYSRAYRSREFCVSESQGLKPIYRGMKESRDIRGNVETQDGDGEEVTEDTQF